MRIVYMGTPDFSVKALEALINAGHEVAVVVTQPDKPKGRGKEVQYPPVKACALAHGIPVFQPARIKSPEAVEKLKEYGAELFVVAAFGQILSKEILDMPVHGCINIHASLLPKYRGAAPIQWAVIHGEKESGITIIQMNEGCDTGDMLLKKPVPLDPKETGQSLHDKLSEAGAAAVVEAIRLIEEGKLKPVAQNDEDSVHAPKLNKSMGRIDWSKSSESIECLVRGLYGWPSAYTSFRGKVLKIWEADADQLPCNGEPGTIAEVTRDRIIINTGNGRLSVKSLQLEGKKRMDVKDFLLGYSAEQGESLDLR